MDKFELDEAAVEETITELATGLAANFGAVADVLTSWRRPEVARAVLESLLNRDGGAFQRLLVLGADERLPDPLPDPDEPPGRELPDIPDFCTILFEVTASLAPQKKNMVCRLRTDLSPAERFMAAVIAWRCGLVIDKGLTVVGGPGPIVPPGPCLDTLNAAGLVTCKEEPIEGVSLQFGPPTHVCARP